MHERVMDEHDQTTERRAEPAAYREPDGSLVVNTREAGPEPDAPTGEAPGEVPGEVPGEASAALRERWREIQLGFVDDPQHAAAQADQLLGEAIDQVTARLTEQRTALAGWRSSGGDGTEQLRVHLKRYRDLLDQMLSL